MQLSPYQSSLGRALRDIQKTAANENNITLNSNVWHTFPGPLNARDFREMSPRALSHSNCDDPIKHMFYAVQIHDFHIFSCVHFIRVIMNTGHQMASSHLAW